MLSSGTIHGFPQQLYTVDIRNTVSTEKVRCKKTRPGSSSFYDALFDIGAEGHNAALYSYVILRSKRGSFAAAVPH